MPRVTLILLLAWAYGGCVGRPAGTPPSPNPVTRGGVVRVLTAAPGDASMLRARLAGDDTAPFRDAGDGRLVANAAYAGPGPFLERVEFVRADAGEFSLMLRLGEADLAVVYGRDAGGLLADPRDAPRLVRAPGWDRTYFLWLEPSRRWVNDPAFRCWLAGRLDRESMLRFLFDDRGSAAYSLTPPGPASPVWPTRDRPPFASSSTPELTLHFDAADPLAASIAARVKAVIQSAALMLRLRPRLAREMDADLRQRKVSVSLLSHVPATCEAVSDLRLTFERLGPAARPALDYLVQAARSPEPLARGDAAWLAEDALLLDAKLIPLIRLHAWVATRPGLHGVSGGPYGVLHLERAWWGR